MLPCGTPRLRVRADDSLLLTLHLWVRPPKLRSLEQCVRYPIMKDLKYFELLRYGYKSFMIQSRQIDKKF